MTDWLKLGQLVRAIVEHRYLIPLFSSTVHAGFPSPADNFIEDALSLESLCLVHPEATRFYRVKGDCMVDARIHEGDVLVVDCAIDPSPRSLHGKIVVAIIGDEFIVRWFVSKEPLVVLMPANPNYSPIYLQPNDQASIVGVVVRIVAQPPRRPPL